MATSKEVTPSTVVPQSRLLTLRIDQIKPSTNNPRHLFDPLPLKALRDNIREHGVLVPITVYQIKGQERFAILDGERRYKCCVDLKKEGRDVGIPANVVDPPSKIAGILYMFSIHNFREGWELMPTALSLNIIMQELGTNDNATLTRLTGLSEPQIERCKILLSFPEKFQKLSLNPDPKERIPSNFWIEIYPVLNLCEQVLPNLVSKYRRDGITQMLVDKYEANKIKSVIHFRRIMEAYEVSDGARDQVVDRLSAYILDKDLETRRAFDEFVVDNRRIQGAITACEEFIRQMDRLKIDYALEKDDVKQALENLRDYITKLISKLEGSDQPAEVDDEE